MIDDKPPYISRETLFRWLNERDEAIGKLMAERRTLIAALEAHSVHVELEEPARDSEGRDTVRREIMDEPLDAAKRARALDRHGGSDSDYHDCCKPTPAGPCNKFKDHKGPCGVVVHLNLGGH